MADLTSINQIVITAKDDTGTGFASVSQKLKALGVDVTGLASTFGDVEKALTAVGAIVGAGSFGAAIASAIEYQASLARMAAQTGATVESLSAMRTAAKFAGVDMDTVAQSMARFAASAVAAQAGTGKQAEALRALGFNAQTFATQFKTTDQAVLAVAKALDQYQDGLGKTAIEQAIFGRSGAQLGEFLHELAARGTDAAKVSTEQALAAKELEDAITKLKSSFTDLVNNLATALVPILQKVVDGFGTFKTIGLAAIVAFVVWPATVKAVAAAVTVLTDSLVGARVAMEVMGTRAGLAATLLRGIQIPAELAAGGLIALQASANLLFAAFAGWELGKWLSDNFLQAKLAGIAFVDSMLTGWENIKYGAQVAWAFLQYAFDQAIESMRQSFASFVAWVAQALSHIPGASGIAEALQGFAATAAGSAGQALSNFNAKLAQLGAANDTAKAKIHDITTDLMAMAIATDAGSAATAKAAKQPPPVPAAGAQKVRDLTAALDAYLKSGAALQKAYIDATATSQLQAIDAQEADLKRAYDRGVVDFQAYWDQLTTLQKQAIDVQIAQTQSEVANQQSLVGQLQASAEKAAAALSHLTPVTNEYVAAQLAATKAQTDLNNANAKLITSTGHLTDLEAKGAQVGKDYVEQLTAATPALLASNRALQDQIQQQQLANETYGLTASQIQLVIAARDQDILSQAQANGASAETIAALQKQIELRHQLATTLKQGEDQKAMMDMIKSIDTEAQQVWTDLFNGGHDTFKKLGDDIKKYLIDLLYQLTVRPILINVAASMTNTSAQGIAGALGQGSNPLLNLLGGNNGSNLLSSGASGLAGSFAMSGVGQAIGLSAPIAETAGGLSLGVEAGAGATAAAGDLGLTAAGAGLATAASFIPVVGLVIAALFASGVFDSKPSETKGQFQISPGTTGFEDNAYTPSAYGNLGFNDANTQQFSGQAAQVFNQMVGGALDAFHSRFSAEQSDKFATILKTMTFDAFEGTYTTEDFIKKYGGQVLQQVVVAAFQVLDPALADVAKNFSGTADEVAKFSNTLLGIYDATKSIGSDDFTKTIDATLQGADQATADKVLAFVTIVQGLSPALDGLSESMQKIDPANVTKFIDALGGAQQALQGMAFINANFTTSAQQAQQAQTNLSNAWQAAGVTADDLAHAGLSHIPQTHAEMLQLLNSLDLNTQHGRDLAAALINNVAPAFVTVEGTANAAAQAMIAAAQKGEDLYNQHFLTPQEQTANRISVDETALYNATKQGTLLNKVLGDMGLSVIPSTVEGVRQWHDAVIAKYGADSDEAHAMEAAIPDIYDLIDATGGFGDAAQQAAQKVNDAINSISHPVDVNQYLQGVATNIANIQALANEGTGTFGDKLATQITLLGSAMAKTQDQINAAMAKNDFSSIDYLLQPQLAAYKKASAAAADELARYTVLAAQYDSARAEQLVGLQDWYAAQQKLFGGQSDVLAALNVIYKQKWDAIVNGVQSGVNGTLNQLQTLKDGIATYLQGLVISDISPLTAAQKLAAAQQALDADAALAQKGDTGALGRITQELDAFLKLDRDFKGPSLDFKSDFDYYTKMLGDIAGVQPNGQPKPGADATTAISNALPTSGTLASNLDLKALADRLIAAIQASAAATADAHTDDAGTITAAVTTSSTRLAGALTTTLRRRS